MEICQIENKVDRRTAQKSVICADLLADILTEIKNSSRHGLPEALAAGCWVKTRPGLGGYCCPINYVPTVREMISIKLANSVTAPPD